VPSSRLADIGEYDMDQRLRQFNWKRRLMPSEEVQLQQLIQMLDGVKQRG